MKKILSLVCAVALTLSCLTGALPGAAAEGTTSTGTTYYVSSKTTGKGGNNGLSETTPFGGLGAIDWKNLQPGDQVLLEAGSVFDGFIHLVDVHGTQAAPIKIGAYGEGAKPRINGKGQGIWFQDYGQQLDNSWHKWQGYVSSTILLYDCDFIEISGLEITNEVPGEESRFQSGEYQGDTVPGSMDRTGVAGAAKNGGTMEHIYLDDLYIHDVDGNIQDKHMDNGGIQLNALKPLYEASTDIARYDDVRITNCKVENVSRAGICVGYTYQWAKFGGSAISDATAQTYGHTNVYMANNFVKDAGNDAIVALYCFRPLVENNISDGAGVDLPTYGGSQQRFCAGIWPWKCKDGIFQNNEVYNMVGQGNGDGQAYDVDWSDGTIYQYNYSHNNAMGPILFCAAEAYQGVYRYNLSQDDLGCYMTLQANPLAKIYNNVFYTGPGKSVRILHEADSKNNGNAWIANNIFYNNGGTVVVENWTGAGGTKTYTNNLFYGFTTTPTDAAKVVVTEADKVFVDPGKAPAATAGVIAARAVFDGFKLKENSPAIKAGVSVADNGGFDFFGNALDNTPDIGIYNVLEHIVESDSSLKSTVFEVSGQTIKVPVTALSQTTVKNLLDGVTVAKTATKKVTNASDEAQAETAVLADGMKLVITAEDNTTTNTYTVAIKNTYNYKNDFVGGQQGNVWFSQRKVNSAGSMENMTTYYAGWTCWQERNDTGIPTSGYWFAGVSSDKGAMCANGMAAVAMAFRAPADGVVELSFVNQPQFRSGTASRNTKISITVDGVRLGEEYTIPTDSSQTVNIPVQNIHLTKGQYLRVEARDVTAGIGADLYVTPAITYLETNPVIMSADYAIDLTARTIANVPYGTLKDAFLAAIKPGSNTTVKLVGAGDNTEVADGTAVATGMRLEVTVNSEEPVYYGITVLSRPVNGYEDYNRTDWTATTGSEEPTAGGATEGPARYTIDGKLETFWHSAWLNTDASKVWITLDMGQVQQVAKLTCVPRPGEAPNGRILEYKIEVSVDNKTWVTVVEHGVWDTNQTYTDTKMTTFTPCEARYVKLTGLKTGIAAGGDAEAGKKFGTAAEIYIARPVYE